jgi:hypothetical protein
LTRFIKNDKIKSNLKMSFATDGKSGVPRWNNGYIADRLGTLSFLGE